MPQTLDTQTIQQFLSIAFLASFVMGVTQVILTTTAMSDAWQNRWGPIIAIALGVLFAELASAALGPVSTQSAAAAALTGLMAGFSAMGLHNTATKSVVSNVVSNAFGVVKAPPTDATVQYAQATQQFSPPAVTPTAVEAPGQPDIAHQPQQTPA